MGERPLTHYISWLLRLDGDPVGVFINEGAVGRVDLHIIVPRNINLVFRSARVSMWWCYLMIEEWAWRR